jgi:hypothetical protein
MAPALSGVVASLPHLEGPAVPFQELSANADGTASATTGWKKSGPGAGGGLAAIEQAARKLIEAGQVDAKGEVLNTTTFNP